MTRPPARAARTRRPPNGAPARPGAPTHPAAAAPPTRAAAASSDPGRRTGAAAERSRAAMSAPPLILLAAEEPALRAFLADNLTADGYRVLVAEDKPSALTALATHRPALAILDVNGDTLGLLDAVRAGDGVAGRIAPDTPLMVLTARAEELERVRLY